MKLKALIIDDEADAIDTLSLMIEEFIDDVEIIGKSQSPLEGLKLLKQAQPDLLFLDIEMPGLTGLELMELIDDRDFHLVFVTAYEEYAIKAIRMKADDYLLKPVNPIELEKAVQKLREHKELESEGFEVLHNKIALPVTRGIQFVELDKIERIEADNSYSEVFLTSGESYVVCRKIKCFEECLNNKGFLRIHRSCILNLRHIEKYSSSDGGYIVMQSGVTVYVPRRNKDKVLELLQQYTITPS